MPNSLVRYQLRSTQCSCARDVYKRQDLEPGLPMVLADPESIRRAIANLIDNAAEAMQGSLLRVLGISSCLSEDGAAVELTISDTGHGPVSYTHLDVYKRQFQLRIYESPSDGEHVRKVEMFHAGEFDIFVNAGCHPVFFADSLIGPRLPNLTYMLTFADIDELNAKWDIFRNDPAWKKLSSNPRYAFDQIVTNITNLVLSPLACSQL